jgi:hypothetical protein
LVRGATAAQLEQIPLASEHASGSGSGMPCPYLIRQQQRQEHWSAGILAVRSFLQESAHQLEYALEAAARDSISCSSHGRSGNQLQVHALKHWRPLILYSKFGGGRPNACGRRNDNGCDHCRTGDICPILWSNRHQPFDLAREKGHAYSGSSQARCSRQLIDISKILRHQVAVAP